MLHAVVPFFVVSLCLKPLLPRLWLLLPWWLWCLLVLSCLSAVTMASSLMGLPATLGKHDVVLPPPLTLRCPATTTDTQVPWRCYWPCNCATAATPIFDASSVLCQLCMGSPQVGFFFRVEPPTILYIICLVSVLVSAFFLLSGAMLDAIFTSEGSTMGVCTIATLWKLPLGGIYATWWWSLAIAR